MDDTPSMRTRVILLESRFGGVPVVICDCGAIVLRECETEHLQKFCTAHAAPPGAA